MAQLFNSGVDLLGLVEELEEVDVGTQVPDLEARRLEEKPQDVLADRVQVALDGAQDDPALLGPLAAALLDPGLEHRHGGLEGKRGLHELGEEDLLLLEPLTDDAEAREQPLVDDSLGRDAGREGLLDGRQDRLLVLVDDGLLELLEDLSVRHVPCSLSRRTCVSSWPGQGYA